MENLVFCLNATIPIFLTLMLGLLFRRIGLFDDAFVSRLNKFVFNAALPALLFLDIAKSDFYSVWNTKFVVFCFFVTLISIGISTGLSYLLKPRNIQGEFIQASYRSSAAILGIAIIQNLYGNAGMAPLMIIGSVPLYNVMAVTTLSLFAPGGGKLDTAKLVRTLKGIATNPIILRALIQNKTAGTPVYKECVRLLTDEGNTEEVRNLLKHSSKEIQEACRDYICETPVSNPAPGTYTSVQTLELKADCSEIYYTLDGSVPTRKSALYTGPITLGEGTTEVKAFGVNDKNIESDVITRKYIIVLKTPDAPEVTPESGDYDKKTEIRITVPDGCKAYYAFDSQPDINSTVYEQPISMPVGYHVLNVVLVAANGKMSKVTSMEYYLQY